MSALTLTPELQARAVAIADECSRNDVETTGVPLDEEGPPRHFGLTNDSLEEVRTLAEASPFLRTAFEYLRDRGLAELVTNDGDELIQLHLDLFGTAEAR